MSQECDYLRKKNIFKLIPMINVDGVVCGNYRTNLAGHDLNRSFKKNFNKTLLPEISFLLKMIEDSKKNHKIMAFIDLHGHSIKRNAFIYGPFFPPNKLKYYT